MVKETDNFYKKHEKWIVLLLLLLSYPLFFYKLGARDIWEPDEDEYIQVNREMVDDGHWLYPTANARPYSIKPPLFNWIGSAFGALNGDVTEHTSRLPSAMAAAAGLLILYFMARKLFGPRAALLSALVIGTSPLYLQLGRWVQIHMVSTALLMATLGLFYWGYSDDRKRGWTYPLMYVSAALGTLNAGLVSVVMPAIVIGLYLIAVRDPKSLLRLRIGWGLLIYFAIVAPWYALVSLKGNYAQNLIVATHFTRYFKEWWHARPFYYYLGSTPAYFLPWFIFLPGAFYLCLSERTKNDRKRLLFPFVWSVGLFVFFSLSRTKRSEYVLPIFPAMALLVGAAMERLFQEPHESLLWKRLVKLPLLSIIGLLLIAGVLISIYGVILSGGWFLVLLPISFVLVWGAVVTFLLFQRNKPMQAMVAIALTVVVSLAYCVGPVVAKRNETKSAKSFCMDVLGFLRSGENLKMYRFYRPVYGVYTRRLVDVGQEPDTLLKWFESKEPVYVITSEREFLGVKDRFPEPIHVLIRKWIDHRYILLISNRAALQSKP